MLQIEKLPDYANGQREIHPRGNIYMYIYIWLKTYINNYFSQR